MSLSLLKWAKFALVTPPILFYKHVVINKDLKGLFFNEKTPHLA